MGELKRRGENKKKENEKRRVAIWRGHQDQKDQSAMRGVLGGARGGLQRGRGKSMKTKTEQPQTKNSTRESLVNIRKELGEHRIKKKEYTKD